MADDDIETIRKVYAAFNGRDMDLLQHYFAEDAEIFQTPEVPWGGEYRGHHGLYTFLVKAVEHVDTQIVPEALFAAGHHVVQMGRLQGRARANGAPFDVPVVHLWELRDGLVVRYESYIDTPVLLAALAREP
jgi:ketosteroid isomerase-like protein